MLHRRRSRDAGAVAPTKPVFMSDEQVGQQPFAHNASLRRSFLKFSDASQPSEKPSSSRDQFTVDFLKDLRNNRPARPGGARPLPGSNSGAAARLRHEVPPRAESAMDGRFTRMAVHDEERPSSAVDQNPAPHTTLDRSNLGRPLARPHAVRRDISGSTMASKATSNTSSSSDSQGRAPDIRYYERGQRWMEKQESKSLSVALEEMDIKESQRIHKAAQDEASDLVWKHQNPGAPYKNPDMDLKQHLRKGSHARSQSVGPFDALYIQNGGTISGSRSSSGASTSTTRSRIVSSGSHASNESSDSGHGHQCGDHSASQADVKSRSSRVKAYGSLNFHLPRPRSLSRRRNDVGAKRATSGESEKSLFKNPNDHIYEEPEAESSPATTQSNVDSKVLKDKPRNTSYGLDSIKDKGSHWQSTQAEKTSKVEIHKNPPSQSRNAGYTKTKITVAVTPETTPKMKGDLEFRGDDIRAATSKSLRDRSPKLPMPSIISDRPGRPIVSFEQDYKPREIELRHETSGPSTDFNLVINDGKDGFQKPVLLPSNSEPLVPSINISASPDVRTNEPPLIPSISIEGIPEIQVSSELPQTSFTPVPSIQLPGSGSTRPLPKPTAESFPQPANRPLPRHSSTAPVKSSPHWSPAHHAMTRGQAQCAACALPIAGKIVTAASQRFHPACFSCFNCGELLECVAFYPEPDSFRSERLARIQARMEGLPIPENQQQHTEQDDGDSGLRFYCHLDFHEKFSPRCRSCKTPIEGEVIVACGGEWHAGHFFCAECGDPFDQTTPFVEKDGFAWCVGCHTRRYSGKCAGCRKPIVETVVKALDREWHEDCFCCKECGNKFKDGRFFTRDGNNDHPVCVRCEEMRLKA